MGSEVKGTWFVTFRAWASGALDQGAVIALAAAMPRYGAAIAEPMQGEWYPEDALHELLEALYDHVGRDPARFVGISRDVSIEGVGRFFRAVLALSTPGFLLRQVPTMWRRLRRGDQARIEVRPHPEGSIVDYRDFPWFRHEVYALFTQGSLTALVQLAQPDSPGARPQHLGPTEGAFLVVHR